MFLGNYTFDLVNEVLSRELYPGRNQFNKNIVLHWHLLWNLDSPKIPESSIITDTFRHSISCLTVSTTSIFSIKVSIANVTLVQDNKNQKTKLFRVLMHTSDSLKFPKHAIIYKSSRITNAFVFSVLTGLISSIKVSIGNRRRVKTTTFTEQVILFPGSKFC